MILINLLSEHVSGNIIFIVPEYPILNTGVTSGDSLRTEKTLPQLTAIKAFPTTLYIGKDGIIREIHPGFSGPATGIHYTEFCANFEKTIAKLLNE
jgi:hypothetical protein